MRSNIAIAKVTWIDAEYALPAQEGTYLVTAVEVYYENNGPDPNGTDKKKRMIVKALEWRNSCYWQRWVCDDDILNVVAWANMPENYYAAQNLGVCLEEGYGD